MEDLFDFVFKDLLSKLDFFASGVPRNEQELRQTCLDLEKILIEHRELVQFVAKAISLSED